MFSVPFMYSIIWVFTVKRPSWNGNKLWKRKVVPMGDLRPQIVGHMIFSLKSPSYCPYSHGDQKSRKADQWRAYLKKNITKNFISFLHHRFNVIFLLGGNFYFHREKIIELLKSMEYENVWRKTRC